MAETRPSMCIVVPGVAGAVFASLYALHGLGDESLYRAVLLRWGVVPFAFPFVDTHFVLSSLACARRGIDVYAVNPCDVLGRLFNYSPALLWARGLDVTVADTQAAGLTLDGLFLLSMVALPTPRSVSDAALMLFATLSTMTAFAVERANLDLLVFILTVLVARLVTRKPGARLVAFGVAGLAAVIKFYPAVLLFLTARERPRIFFAVNAAIGALLAFLAVAYRAELALAFANLPKRIYFTDMFGAANLPFGLAAVSLNIAPLPLLAALTVIALAVATWLACRHSFKSAVAAIDEIEHIFLLVGCALIVGCFFAGGSVGYRGVFLILTLPGFLLAGRRADTIAMRALFSTTVLFIVFVMWGEFFRAAIVSSGANRWFAFAFWLIRELIWWWIVSVLGATLLRFALDSEVARIFGLWRMPRLKFGGAE